MYLPINGRVAIIDNEIKEAEPLFKIFSKHRIPYIFIKGNDIEYLPEEEDNLNDIRLLFLDLNLIDHTIQNDKAIRGILTQTLKRVISKGNFPYSIILWSTQEKTYRRVVDQIFQNELSDRAPISIEEFVKSDYVDLDGNILKDVDISLIEKMNEIFKKQQSYSTLVYWENKVHKSADEVLQTIFHSHDKEWTNQSNFIVSKLGLAYLGKKKYQTSGYIEKTKGSLQAFNNIFFDSLETNINTCSNLHAQAELVVDKKKINGEKLIDVLNSKLLFSKSDLNPENMDYTGNVCEDKNTRSELLFNKLFEDIFSEQEIVRQIKIENTNLCDDSKESKDKRKKILSDKIAEIKYTMQRVYIVITPLCDYIQSKQIHIRLLKGVIIDKKYAHFLINNEAIFTTPAFHDDVSDTSRVLVTNFKHFFTVRADTNVKNFKKVTPIFRLRGDVVGDIKSKLARHVTRQGILFIE